MQQVLKTKIEKLSHEGRGIAKLDGKTLFLQGGLPGEEVEFRLHRKKSRFAEGQVLNVLSGFNKARINPGCSYAELCGGCSLQHISLEFQLQHKQSVLLEQLEHIGGVQPREVLLPITGSSSGYRRKARLGVRYVPKKEKVLVGFREKNGRYLTEQEHCMVLDPRVGEKLDELQGLIQGLTHYDQIAQIEVAAGDDAVALVFRNLVDLLPKEKETLSKWGQENNIWVYLQGNKNKIECLYSDGDVPYLSYELASYDLKLFFDPFDFVQVNAQVNQKMIDAAMGLLDPKPGDVVLDLFSGLGNFSLPLAKLGAEVHAVEGTQKMVERGSYNAEQNQIDRINFYCADLSQEVWEGAWSEKKYNKLLIDPPRTGALEIVQKIHDLAPKKILYVSCNSATLARDAGVLGEQGYILAKAGVMDMFPHTQHVECMALFVRKE